MDAPILNGLVLAGGQSTRMGSDKSLIDYHGKSQREYLFEALQSVCSDVYTSCRQGGDVPSFLNPLPDKMSIKSPLNGILSAFDFCSDCAWLTVAVDLPNVTREVLKDLRTQRNPRKLATCFFDSKVESIEPLLTIWEPGARPLLAANAAKGDVSPRSFLLNHDVHVIYGADPAIFLNVNDPASLSSYASKNDQGNLSL